MPEIAATKDTASMTQAAPHAIMPHGGQNRRAARVRDGRLVTLAEQDRDRWHRDEIRIGLALVDAIAPDTVYAEELRLQALVAAEHARAATAAATDWSAIAAHYAALDDLTGSAVVRLNRAVAVAEASGPEAGLALLVDLDERLSGTHRLAAVRGELARRAGDTDLAARSFRAALATCANEIEREHLQRRLDEVERAPRDTA